jgi:hypothetical protein
MVLGVAMLVPALLAGGLLVAEVGGYDLAVSGVTADVEPWKMSGEGTPVAAASPGASGGSRAPVAIGAAGGDPAESTLSGSAVTGSMVTGSMVTGSEPGGNWMSEPRLVPPPLRPYRVYDGWMPPDVVSLAYSGSADSSAETGGPGEAADRRRKRRASGAQEEPRRGVREPGTARSEAPAEPGGEEAPDRSSAPSPAPSPTPSPAPSAEEPAATEAECSQEWRDTWLWEICLDGNRQKV